MRLSEIKSIYYKSDFDLSITLSENIIRNKPLNDKDIGKFYVEDGRTKRHWVADTKQEVSKIVHDNGLVDYSYEEVSKHLLRQFKNKHLGPTGEDKFEFDTSGINLLDFTFKPGDDKKSATVTHKATGISATGTKYNNASANAKYALKQVVTKLQSKTGKAKTKQKSSGTLDANNWNFDTTNAFRKGLKKYKTNARVREFLSELNSALENSVNDKGMTVIPNIHSLPGSPSQELRSDEIWPKNALKFNVEGRGIIMIASFGQPIDGKNTLNLHFLGTPQDLGLGG